MIDAAIIGGGVSGLAAAYALRRRGHKVVVLERQARTGGNAISERIDGFLMEHGPSTVAAESAAACELSSALGLDDGKCDLGEGVRRRYLVGKGRLRGIPVHPMGFFASDYLSLGARLRMLAEPLVRDGYAIVGDKPGLGIELDEEGLARHPYQPFPPRSPRQYYEEGP